MLVVLLITPPTIDEEGCMEYARRKNFTSSSSKSTSSALDTILQPRFRIKFRSLYDEKAIEQPKGTNELTGVHAKQCVELAKKLGLPSINLRSKMQETEDWQKKFLSLT